MKTKILRFLGVVFLVSIIMGIHAQNAAQQLNQQELIKKFTGTWNMQVSKDTIEVWEFKPCGKSFPG